MAVAGAALSAGVVNTADPNGTFLLTLTAYAGVVRLHLNERAPDAARFEVPDVLLPGLGGLEEAWQDVRRGKEGVTLRLGAADVELRYSPVELTVSLGGAPALVWNAGRHFQFEHLRAAGEGDPEGWWAESFKSHHDSKPRGPEAISFDLSFPGVGHVYGLPERATDLSLRTTVNGARAGWGRQGGGQGVVSQSRITQAAGSGGAAAAWGAPARRGRPCLAAPLPHTSS